MYFDYNGTTPVDPKVVEEMSKVTLSYSGNPSSSNKEGRNAKKIIEEARESISRIIGIPPNTLRFTSSATESNNTVLYNILSENVRGRTILTTRTEHASVIQTAMELERENTDKSVKLTYIPVNELGLITFDSFYDAVTPDVGIVSIIYANNETGTIQDDNVIQRIGRWCRSRGVIFHLDVTQAVGKIPINLRNLRCSTASFSAHKFYGPRGIGGLYVDESVKVRQLMKGGLQEKNTRAGTENVPGIHGMAVALDLAIERLEVEGVRVRRMRDFLREKLLESIDNSVVFGPYKKPTSVLPNTISISIPCVNSRDFMDLLDRENASVNVGSACGKGKRSMTLEAMGVPESVEKGIFRISLGRHTTYGECKNLYQLFVNTWLKVGTTPCNRDEEKELRNWLKKIEEEYKKIES